MAVLTRLFDFIPNTLIQSAQVDSEFAQLVDILSGVSTTKNALIKFSDATIPPLTLDQTGAGLIQSWKQNGVEVASVNNSGGLIATGLTALSAGPFLNLTDTDGEDFRLSVNADVMDIINQTGPITFMSFRGGANDDIQILRPIRSTVSGSTPPILVVKEGTASATVPLVGAFPALNTLQTTNITNYWNLAYVNDAATSNWANYVTNGGTLQFENYTTGNALQGFITFLETGIVSSFSTNGGAYFFTKTAGVTNGGSLIQTATSEFHLAFGTSNDPGTHTKALTWTDVGVGINKSSSVGAQLHVVTGAAARVALIAQGAAAQTARLIRAVDSASGNLVSIAGAVAQMNIGASATELASLSGLTINHTAQKYGALVTGGAAVIFSADNSGRFAIERPSAYANIGSGNNWAFQMFPTTDNILIDPGAGSGTADPSAQLKVTSGATTRIGFVANNPSGSTVPIAEFRTNNVAQATVKNNGHIIGVPKCIHTNGTATGNVTTGLDDLHSFSLPAASLNANGDYLRVRYSGTFATNDNDKRILISFAGQTVHDTGLFDQDQGSWSYDIGYLRLSDTSVRASIMGAWFFIARDGAGTTTGNGFLFGLNITLTVADLDVNASTMKVQAEGTASDDIVQNLSIIELTQNT